MIIALGYRIQSEVEVRFRILATKKIHEYIQKGFAMDNEYLNEVVIDILKNYYKELGILDLVKKILSTSNRYLYNKYRLFYCTSCNWNKY